MIRRLVRWIARAEIAQAKAEVAANMLGDAMKCYVSATEQYLKGLVDGERAVLDAIEKAVRERNGGATDTVTEGDIAQARKGLLH